MLSYCECMRTDPISPCIHCAQQIEDEILPVWGIRGLEHWMEHKYRYEVMYTWGNVNHS